MDIKSIDKWYHGYAAVLLKFSTINIKIWNFVKYWYVANVNEKKLTYTMYTHWLSLLNWNKIQDMM